MEDLSKETFEAFVDLLYKKTGITLKKGKEALFINRVNKHLRRLGLNDYNSYLDLLQSDQNPKELVNFQNSLSTNLTSFFRENHHFKHFRKILIENKTNKKEPFKIWSAACSSGEEAYSAAITVQNTIGGDASKSCKILATDINTEMIDHASKGVYEYRNIDKISPDLINACFSKESFKKYVVKQNLRKSILFKNMNLASHSLPLKSNQFDFIFCRNVMIYFDALTRQTLLGEISRVLKNQGVIYLGHADTISDLRHDLILMGNTIYMKKKCEKN